jgi:ubiquinol-cytochrome c reductase cytochrome b subunit
MAGIGYFRQENCASCHAMGDGSAKIGPDLALGVRKSAAWMIQHFKRPAAMVPGSAMPSIQLSDAQLNTLAAFLLKLNPRNAEALQSAPAFAVEGAVIYQNSQCGSCHMVNGVGVKLGPSLNGLRQRRTQHWVEDHFRNPQAVSPGSIMPPYRFSPSAMERIVAYLFVLPG